MWAHLWHLSPIGPRNHGCEMSMEEPDQGPLDLLQIIQGWREGSVRERKDGEWERGEKGKGMGGQRREGEGREGKGKEG